MQNHALCRTGRAGIHPGQWYQLTELIVVTLKEGLAALLLFTGLLAAARGVAAAVLLSSGWEVCLVLESKKEKCVSVPGEIWMPLFSLLLSYSHQIKVGDVTTEICAEAMLLQAESPSPKALTCSLCISSSF